MDAPFQTTAPILPYPSMEIVLPYASLHHVTMELVNSGVIMGEMKMDAGWELIVPLLVHLVKQF